jgi:hypothetical protein
MNHFDAIGATAPKFSIGDRVLTSVTDPDEGLFIAPAIVAGLVWDVNCWSYAVMFEGYASSDFGWDEGELEPLEESSRDSQLSPNSPIKMAQTIAA